MLVRREFLSHDHVDNHVDIEEEPGTYRSNWACMAAMLIGLLAIFNGHGILGRYGSLGALTMATGALVLILNAARLFAGAKRWASQLTILLGIWSWYSAHLLGVDPTVQEYTVLWLCWSLILTGVGYVFMGTWAALGAPGEVEREPFWTNLES
jgi:hypothetical protein